MRAAIGFFKREVVLTVALAAAIASMFVCPPDAAYVGYIDWNTLSLLFSLMAVVALFQESGLISRACRLFTSGAGSARALARALSAACFFFAMLVTNDVSLIAFVPITLAALRGADAKTVIRTVALETAAANLGSMLTPIGNPQNVYLYAHYGMPFGQFIGAVWPYAAASLVLIEALCRIVPKTPLALEKAAGDAKISGKDALLAGGLFALCLLVVFKAIPAYAAMIAVMAVLLALRRSALKGVDYALLLTFACFFVFVGNLGRLDAVKTALTGFVAGRETEAGILLSQVISNVPAALMLAGFTGNVRGLLVGVNLGGLGTLVASLASLISFKLYMRSENAKGGAYLLAFTAVNVALLAALYGLFRLIS